MHVFQQVNRATAMVNRLNRHPHTIKRRLAAGTLALESRKLNEMGQY